MDRLKTGRRHVRAGSVHVTELIGRQQPRTRVPAPLAATPRPDRELDLDTLVRAIEPFGTGPVTHRQPQPRRAQLAKLTGLGAATLVLCGSVAAATVISHERADQEAAERPTIRITGDQALLPDQLDRTLPANGSPAPPPPARPRVAQRPAPPSTTPESADEPAPPTPGTAAPEAPVATPLSDVELVERYYHLLPKDPHAAFDLISPDLLSTSLGEFLDSWSTVRGIEVVDIHQQADGVLAVVRMTLDDGHHIRVEQLLTVADSPRRIVGVQLLSAQHN